MLETGGSEPPITDPEYTETEPETEAELPSPPRSPVRKSVEFATDAPMPSAASRTEGGTWGHGIHALGIH